VQNKKFGGGTRYNSIWPSLIVTELHEHRVVLRCFHDRTDLSARQRVGRTVGEKRDHIE